MKSLDPDETAAYFRAVSSGSTLLTKVPVVVLLLKGLDQPALFFQAREQDIFIERCYCFQRF